MAYLHLLPQHSAMIPATALYPTIRMSPTMPNMFGRPLKTLLILIQNMSLAGATP